MSTGPDKADYQPTDADKANASVALQEYRFFKQNYDPLLRKMRDKSMSDQGKKVARGRANADTMQALTSGINYDAVGRDDLESLTGEGLMGQLGVANQTAEATKNDQAAGVLASARGQAASGQQGMSNVARLRTSEVLQKAQTKQAVAQAKFNAGAQLVSTGIGQGIKNIAGGGEFATPAVTQDDGSTRLATGLYERLAGKPKT